MSSVTESSVPCLFWTCKQELHTRIRVREVFASLARTCGWMRQPVIRHLRARTLRWSCIRCCPYRLSPGREDGVHPASISLAGMSLERRPARNKGQIALDSARLPVPRAVAAASCVDPDWAHLIKFVEMDRTQRLINKALQDVETIHSFIHPLSDSDPKVNLFNARERREDAVRMTVIQMSLAIEDILVSLFWRVFASHDPNSKKRKSKTRGIARELNELLTSGRLGFEAKIKLARVVGLNIKSNRTS